MKNILQFLSLLLFTIPTFAQVCPNNIASNGDLSSGNPATSGSNNIGNATDFSPIWSNVASAEFYQASVSIGTSPTPATGNYVSCWIANHNYGGTGYREGFRSKLATQISYNTGNYELTFDMACLKGWGSPEVAVYGVYNPSGNLASAPTGQYSPLNTDLYGSNNTVLLGTISVNTCSNVKSHQSIVFNSNGATFPTNGITHFFITHSDNQSLSGARYMAFDNFCIQPVPCPDITTVANPVCTNDMNGDGISDYTMQITTTNAGTINLSIPCASVSPTTISTPGTHTLTILPGSSCTPSQLNFSSIDNLQSNCSSGSFPLNFPNCAPPSCGYVSNGDLSHGTAASSGHQNIDHATDFDRIWQGGGTAEFYVETYAAGYTPPAPATGNFVSCWIASHNYGHSGYREGFKSKLAAPIYNNTGSYELTFDMACLNGWGAPQLAVYGVYNPNGAPAPTTTGHFTPANIDLYGSNNTVLLGTVDISNNCSNTKAGQLIQFNSDASNFPTNGITHFFVTNSSDQSFSGARYMAFDNFCIEEMPLCPEVTMGAGAVSCIGDINGDGANDYSVSITITNPGHTYFSSPCGTVSPTSIASAGNHTLTFTSGSASCSPTIISYFSTFSNNPAGVDCNSGDLSFTLPSCPATTCGLVSNGDLEHGTAASSGHENIADATDFNRIWQGAGGAEFYVETYAPTGYTPPSPATGNYVSCWIASHNYGGTLYREGFKSKLATPIQANTGGYELNFDMACLNGWDAPELAVYGVYNPNGALAATPTGHYTPSNMALYGASNTVLLGTISINTCSNTKSQQSITFNSSTMGFPAAGITHFFVTHSDNQNFSGARYMAFDNFCIQPWNPCPCDKTFQLGVASGFTRQVTCLGDIFTPNNLTSCDQVEWLLNNTVIGTTTGNQPFAFPHNNLFYQITMRVTRAQGNATSCTEKFTLLFRRKPCDGDIGIGFPVIALSPNPVNNQLNLNWNTQDIPNQLFVRVFSANGVEVRKSIAVNGNEGTVSINVEDLSSGLYFVKVEGENYTPAPIKFVKR